MEEHNLLELNYYLLTAFLILTYHRTVVIVDQSVSLHSAAVTRR
jgi:hypothetical protein